MPMSPHEMLMMLRKQHIDDLTTMQGRCLGAVAIGYDDPDAAAMLGIGESTLRHHVGEAEGRALDRLGLPRTRPRAVSWFWLHERCCTAGIVKLIETNALGGGRDERNWLDF